MASPDPEVAAAAYAALFPAVFVRFHRRAEKKRGLTGASRAVLMHLAQSGPLTVTECAKHLGRAQSVMSEIIDQLEAKQILARVRDEDDRRRVVVWLTDEGRRTLTDDQQVLSFSALEAAMKNMKPRDRDMLLQGTRALISSSRREGRASSTKSKR